MPNISTLSDVTSVPGKLIVLEPLSLAHADELLPIARDESLDRDDGRAVRFVVRWRETGALVGQTRLKDYSAEHRRVTIGSWFTPAVWGLGANSDNRNTHRGDGDRRDDNVYSLPQAEWSASNERLLNRIASIVKCHTMQMLVLILLALSLIHGGSAVAQSTTATPKPNLVIVISVDMLSEEIMDRYTAGLPGGLGKLLAEGVVFENAYQEHAFTETCPGHATLLSGRHPSSTGIGTNSWIDSSTGKRTYCVEDDHARTFGEASGAPGSSAVRFRGTTLGTWLKDELPGSRVFAVAGKDRSAILMAGPKTDGVYWFQEGFGFTTSTAYADTIPQWLAEFNAGLMHRLRTETLTWVPMGPSDGGTYPGEWKSDITGYPIVSRLPRLIQTQGFPDVPKAGFVLNETQDGGFWNRYRASPFWDDAIFGAAEALIEHEHLGLGKHLDLLCLGLSATNAAEHAYGNSGPEMQDLIRRLDARLGTFLNRLQHQGKRVVLVLSADHGGLDFAERLRSQGIPARRIDVEAWMKELQARVQHELGTSTNLLSGGDEQIHVDHAAAAAIGDPKQVIGRVTAIVRTMPEVAAAASLDELRALPHKRFSDARDEDVPYRLKLSAAEGRSADILFAFNPLVERDGPPTHDPAQHGTPWDYDRRVPLIFWGPWKPERRSDPASTVDIAPTLAKELRIKPEEAVDGIPLRLAPRVRVSRIR